LQDSCETITRIKGYPAEWEKIFTNYSRDKGLISRIYKVHKKLNSKRITNPINKWENELNSQF
jgi:hypothetical protein